MSKFILVFAVALFFAGCGKDNEGSDQDILLGKWKLIEIRENGIINKIACQDAVLLVFKPDGSFDVEHFEDDNDKCISKGKIDEGTWQSVGKDAYIIDGDKITPTFEDNPLIMVSTNGDESTSKGVFERQ